MSFTSAVVAHICLLGLGLRARRARRCCSSTAVLSLWLVLPVLSFALLVFSFTLAFSFLLFVALLALGVVALPCTKSVEVATVLVFLLKTEHPKLLIVKLKTTKHRI